MNAGTIINSSTEIIGGMTLQQSTTVSNLLNQFGIRHVRWNVAGTDLWTIGTDPEEKVSKAKLKRAKDVTSACLYGIMFG